MYRPAGTDASPAAGRRPAVLRFDLDIAAPDRDARFGRKGPYNLLGYALPVLAVHDGKGWHLDPYSEGGESNYTLTADWTVRLDHPCGIAVPATGTAVDMPARPSRTLTTIVAPRVRDSRSPPGRSPSGRR